MQISLGSQAKKIHTNEDTSVFVIYELKTNFFFIKKCKTVSKLSISVGEVSHSEITKTD